MRLVYWVLVALFFAPFLNWFRVLSKRMTSFGEAVSVVGIFALCWGIGTGIAIGYWLL